MSIVRTAIVTVLLGGLATAPPNIPRPKSKLPPSAGRKTPKPRPEALRGPEYEIGVATQVLAAKPRIQILLKESIPRGYEVRVIEWGGLNRSWKAPVVAWRRNSITASLPSDLHSNIAHLPGRYEVAIYDAQDRRLVSNRVPLRPAKGNTVHLDDVEVYAKEILKGKFEVRFDGVNLLPARDRRLEYRVVVPRHPSGMQGEKRVTSIRANTLEAWNAGNVRSGQLTTRPVKPPDFRKMKLYTNADRRKYDAEYNSRIQSGAYVELRVLDGQGKALSQPVKVPAASWIYRDPPKPPKGVDHDGDGHDSVESGGDDCDDNNNNRYPTNTEIPDFDGADEDCDPSTIGDLDRDRDGYLDYRMGNHKHYPQSQRGTDCDDRNYGVNPGRVGTCGNDEASPPP